MNKKNLQIATAILGLIPLLTGLVTLLGVDDPLYARLSLSGSSSSAVLASSAALDSNLRFFGGLWLVVGLAVFWLVPRIETETKLFRFIWLMIFAGGLGRLLSLLFIGMPPVPFIGFTLLEIFGAPFFIYWQSKIALKI